MLPEKTEFLKVMADVYDAMKAARRKTAVVVYDGMSPAFDDLPAFLVRSRFAFKLTTDRVHIELLKAEREADRLEP